MWWNSDKLITILHECCIIGLESLNRPLNWWFHRFITIFQVKSFFTQVKVTVIELETFHIQSVHYLISHYLINLVYPVFFQTNVGPIVLSVNPYRDVGNPLTLTPTKEAAASSHELTKRLSSSLGSEGTSLYGDLATLWLRICRPSEISQPSWVELAFASCRTPASSIQPQLLSPRAYHFPSLLLLLFQLLILFWPLYIPLQIFYLTLLHEYF